MTAPTEQAPRRRIDTDRLWSVDVSAQPRGRRVGIKTLRVLVLTIKGFFTDECPLRASALTFTTLMAIVPVLAISLSIARMFGGEKVAREKLVAAVQSWAQTFPTPPGSVPDEAPAANLAPQLVRVVEFVFDRIAQLNFGAIGAVGLMFFIWIAIDVLSQIEMSFNRVWGVTVNRRLWRRIADYFTLLLVLPLLILAAATLPLLDLFSWLVGHEVLSAVQKILESGPMPYLLRTGMTTLCFAFLIMFMPNIRVRPSAGFVGGLLTALLFQWWLQMCTALQAMAIGYSRVYGSIAIVPLLLGWVYISWSIILLGAEAAFAIQNRDTYPMEQGSRQASAESRLMLALALVGEAAGPVPDRTLSVDSFARRHTIPVRLAYDVMACLCRAGIFGELAGSASDRYALLSQPESLRVGDVMRAILSDGVPPESLGLAGADKPAMGACRAALEQVCTGAGAARLRDVTGGGQSSAGDAQQAAPQNPT
jgi:membrane protein